MGPLTLKPGEGVWVDRLKVENFRAIAHLELEFRYRLTVLIGENGGGKTTVLDALAAVLQDARPHHQDFQLSDVRRVGNRAERSALIEAYQNGIPIKATILPPSEFPVRLQLQREGDTAGGAGTVKAYFGSDRSRPNSYDELVEWFASKDAEEARQIRESRNLDYRDPELAEVKRAVEMMVPGTINPRIDPSTRVFVVDQVIGGKAEKFEVSELAGGLRTMLVLVADLARMIVSANEGRSTPAQVLVLVDEIDLHLHPAWQLRVVSNLLDAFPAAQFIVSTHSEEIIASVPSECVISLQRDQGPITAAPIPPVQGATFDRVLEDAMGVPGHRPPEFQQQLDDYWRLVDAGAGETPEALALRSKLDDFFRGQEPELVRADLVIRRKRARTGTGS